MDEKFYQFWRDFAGEYVHGRVKLDEAIDWLKKGREMSEPLKTLFQKTYQLDPGAFNPQDFSKFFESAVMEFKNSMMNFYEVLEVVPKQAYLDLEKKYHVLERRLADQEEVIRHLKLLFKTNPPNTEDGIKALNQMLKSQNAQFLEMMDNLGKFYGISGDREPDNK